MNFLNNKKEVVNVPLNKLKRHPMNPFKVTNNDNFKALTESIKTLGIIEPILLRPAKKGMFEIISGQRRVKAAQLAGFATVPAMILEMADEEAVAVMLDCNLCIKNALVEESGDGDE